MSYTTHLINSCISRLVNVEGYPLEEAIQECVAFYLSTGV